MALSRRTLPAAVAGCAPALGAAVARPAMLGRRGTQVLQPTPELLAGFSAIGRAGGEGGRRPPGAHRAAGGA